MRITPVFVTVLVCSLAVSGCLLPTHKPHNIDNFREALLVCRSQHTGRSNQRLALPPDEEHIEKCLAEHGWLPSGEPLLTTTE